MMCWEGIKGMLKGEGAGGRDKGAGGKLESAPRASAPVTVGVPTLANWLRGSLTCGGGGGRGRKGEPGLEREGEAEL